MARIANEFASLTLHQLLRCLLARAGNEKRDDEAPAIMDAMERRLEGVDFSTFRWSYLSEFMKAAHWFVLYGKGAEVTDGHELFCLISDGLKDVARKRRDNWCETGSWA